MRQPALDRDRVVDALDEHRRRRVGERTVAQSAEGVVAPARDASVDEAGARVAGDAEGQEPTQGQLGDRPREPGHLPRREGAPPGRAIGGTHLAGSADLGLAPAPDRAVGLERAGVAASELDIPDAGQAGNGVGIVGSAPSRAAEEAVLDDGTRVVDPQRGVQRTYALHRPGGVDDAGQRLTDAEVDRRREAHQANRDVLSVLLPELLPAAVGGCPAEARIAPAGQDAGGGTGAGAAEARVQLHGGRGIGDGHREGVVDRSHPGAEGSGGAVAPAPDPAVTEDATGVARTGGEGARRRVDTLGVLDRAGVRPRAAEDGRHLGGVVSPPALHGSVRLDAAGVVVALVRLRRRQRGPGPEDWSGVREPSHGLARVEAEPAVVPPTPGAGPLPSAGDPPADADLLRGEDTEGRAVGGQLPNDRRSIRVSGDEWAPVSVVTAPTSHLAAGDRTGLAVPGVQGGHVADGHAALVPHGSGGGGATAGAIAHVGSAPAEDRLGVVRAADGGRGHDGAAEIFTDRQGGGDQRSATGGEHRQRRGHEGRGGDPGAVADARLALIHHARAEDTAVVHQGAGTVVADAHIDHAGQGARGIAQELGPASGGEGNAAAPAEGATVIGDAADALATGSNAHEGIGGIGVGGRRAEPVGADPRATGDAAAAAVVRAGGDVGLAAVAHHAIAVGPSGPTARDRAGRSGPTECRRRRVPGQARLSRAPIVGGGLVHGAIAVVVDTAAALEGPAVGEGVGVVAVVQRIVPATAGGVGGEVAIAVPVLVVGGGRVAVVVATVADLRRRRVGGRVAVVAVVRLQGEHRIVDAGTHHPGGRVAVAIAVEVPVEEHAGAFVEVAVAVLVDAVAGLDGLRRDRVPGVVAILAATGPVAALDGRVAIAVLVAADGLGIAILVVAIEIADLRVARKALRVRVVAVGAPAVDGFDPVPVDVAEGAVDRHAAGLGLAAFLPHETGVASGDAAVGVRGRVGGRTLLGSSAEHAVRTIGVGGARGRPIGQRRGVVPTGGGEQAHPDCNNPSPRHAVIPNSPAFEG